MTNNSFSDLPEYDPHPGLWSRIEADLTAHERLTTVLADLPEYEPAPDAWDTIAQSLDAAEHLIEPLALPTRVVPLRPWWAAAAAVVIMVGVWLSWPSKQSAGERIEYAVETGSVVTAPPPFTVTEADRRAAAFIEQQCAAQTVACQQPAVHELRTQLAELTRQEQRLAQERQTFSNDPALIRAQVQVENQRAEVTKELITLLRT